MPDLRDYRKLEPYSVDELLSIAHALLRDKAGHDVSVRLLRYYTSEGILPKAIGSPKFARYGYEHLVGMLAARALLDQGRKLEEAKQAIEGIHQGETEVAERIAEEWLGTVRAPASPPSLRFSMSSYPQEMQSFSTFREAQNVLRIPLTKRSTLEVSGDADIDRELSEALRKLERLLAKRNRSSY